MGGFMASEEAALEMLDDPHGTMLDARRVTLRRGPAGQFRCEVEGDRCYLDVRASRCFPLARPGRYVALFEGMTGEIGVIPDPRELDRESQEVLEEILERRYFLPVIERVKWAREEYGVVYWSVETDQGPRDFVCRGLRDAVTEVSEGRLLIVDVDGNRFEIPDYTRLGRAIEVMLDRVL
jgi:hypothetical protein